MHLMMQFALASPDNLIETLGGLALLGALSGALVQAFSSERGREGALVCFVVTATGISLGGIGAAFWGLLIGGWCIDLSLRPRFAIVAR